MKATISFRALTITLLIAFSVSYVLCIVGGLLFGWTMYQAWMPLLPGFTWPLTLAGVLVGLLWLVIYSFYTAALIAVPYNYMIKLQNSAQT